MENTVAKIKWKVKRFFHSTKGKIITVLSLIFGGWFLYLRGKNDGKELVYSEWKESWKGWINDWWPKTGDRVVVERVDANKVIHCGFFEDTSEEITELKETIKALTKEVNGNETA